MGSYTMSIKQPKRIKLSRAKGWRMPPNTVKVDRSTKWGNPFIVGVAGTTKECVDMFRWLMATHFCLTCKTSVVLQRKSNQYIGKNIKKLRGKNLACWCALDKPCHADVLLEIANRQTLRVLNSTLETKCKSGT